MALRVAFFGMGGRFSAAHLEAAASSHHVVAIVMARPRRQIGQPLVASLARRLAAPWRNPLLTAARTLRVPVSVARSRSDPHVVERLSSLRPDLICIAGYRWLLPEELVALPSAGTINCHPSLLPRHRGLLPLFWTYYHDDRVAGVTIHRATGRVDTGDILAQEEQPLPRGYRAEHLSLRSAWTGANLLRPLLDDIERDRVRGRPQDESLATDAPLRNPGLPIVDFANWDVERVWHFLSGLQLRHREPLRDARGSPVPYRSVIGYALDQLGGELGVAERRDGMVLVRCRGGVLLLEPDDGVIGRWDRLSIGGTNG